MSDQLIAERTGTESPQPVPLHEVVDRVTAGEVIILRGCLQKLEYLETFQSIIQTVIAAVIDQDRADSVMARGVEYLHLFVNSHQLTEITKRLQSELSTLMLMMVKRVAREILFVEGDAYAEESRNLRIFIPQDTWVLGREEFLQFERERQPGKLTLHGPHTDAWRYHPLNVINLWTAIGPVLSNNGMSFWPGLFGRIPLQGESLAVRSDQVLGRPFGVSLHTGDALLFHIGHIHGSRINQTDQTRFVCSARFTAGEPQLFGKPWYSYMHLDGIPHLIGAAQPPCATGGELPLLPAADIDTADQLPEMVSSSPGDVPGAFVFELDSLRVSEVRPMTGEYCVARTEDGVFAFSRRCPHEGADLAAGYVHEGRIQCPRHNLAIDMTTGRSPCRSLPAIQILPVAIAGKAVTVSGPVPA